MPVSLSLGEFIDLKQSLIGDIEQVPKTLS